jgi:hypothetical protein
MVRLPCTRSSPPSASTRVLRKVIAGWFSASKKSSLRRWLSRRSLRVSMLAVRMSTSTRPPAKFAGSAWTVPLQSLKAPLTLLTMCRMRKVSSECVRSISHRTSACGAAAASAGVAGAG